MLEINLLIGPKLLEIILGLWSGRPPEIFFTHLLTRFFWTITVRKIAGRSFLDTGYTDSGD